MKINIQDLKNGAIIKLNFSPVKGNEQDGFRPALVISNPANSGIGINGMVAVVPITTTKKGFPTHVELDETSITEGSVLLEHLKWVDLKSREFQYVEDLSEEKFKECIKKAKILLFGE